MNLEELVVKLLGVLDAGIAISPDGEIHDDIRDALREEKAEARCTHGIRRPHECKACADEPSKEEIATNMDEAAKLLRTMQPRRELSERDGRQHTHEARRWCSGDSAWSEWQPCTAEQAASYAKDETFQVRTVLRAARGEG